MKPDPHRNRPDRSGAYRTEYDRQRRKILRLAESVGAECYLCRQPINMKLKFPNPYSPTIDHVIPVTKGGHPSDPDNLKIAHLRCNMAKRDKLQSISPTVGGASVGNRVLPISTDWASF